jgi:hypothetical protein
MGFFFDEDDVDVKITNLTRPGSNRRPGFARASERPHLQPDGDAIEEPLFLARAFYDQIITAKLGRGKVEIRFLRGRKTLSNNPLSKEPKV